MIGKLVKIWGLWVVTYLAVLTAEGLQRIGLYIELQAPLVLADACLRRADDLFEALTVARLYAAADREHNPFHRNDK